MYRPLISNFRRSKRREDKTIPLTVDIVVPVYSTASSISSFCGGFSLEENNASNDQTPANNIFFRLPRYLDPNLGMLEKLASIDVSFKLDMNQPWNIAPYFLDIVPSSVDCPNNEDSILIFGGLDVKKNVTDWQEASILGCSIFQYFIGSQTLCYWGSMLEPRCYHAVCLVGLYAYITGGYSHIKCQNGEMMPISSTDRLNLKNMEWKRCSNMNIARAAHAMVAFENCLYVFGGRGLDGKTVSSVEVYNPREDIWLKVSELPLPAMGLSAVTLSDTIWIIGGITLDDLKNKKDSVLSYVYQFSPFTNSWSTMKSLPEPRGYATCIYAFDGVWVFGGCNLLKEDDNTMSSCSSVFYLPLHNEVSKWQTMSSLLHPRHAFSASLSGRNLYVFGGIESSKNSASNKMEIYNLEESSMECTPLPTCIGGSNCVYFNPQYLTMKSSKSSSGMCSSTCCEKYTLKYSPYERRDNLYHKSPSEFIAASCILHCVDVNSNSADSLIENIKKIDVTKSESTVENLQNQINASNGIRKITKSYSSSFVADREKLNIYTGKLSAEPVDETEAFSLDEEQKKSMPLSSELKNYKSTKSGSCKHFVSALVQNIPKSFILEDGKNEKQYKTSVDIVVMNVENPKITKQDYTYSASKSGGPFTTYTTLSSSPKKNHDRHESFFAYENNDMSQNKVAKSVHSSFMYVQSDLQERRQMAKTSVDPVDARDCVGFVSFHPYFENIYRKDSKVQKKYYQEPFYKPFLVKSISDSQIIKTKEILNDKYEAVSCREHTYSEKLDMYQKRKEYKPPTFALSLPTASSKTILTSSVVLILGGESGNSSPDNFLGNVILLFKPQENMWEFAGFLAKPRCHHTTVFSNNTLYVIGGFRNGISKWNEDICAEVLSFNNIERRWKMKPSMNHERAFHSSVVVHSKIFVIGGRNSFGEILSSVEVFSEEDKSWRECQPLPYPILSASVTAVHNFIYVFGGITIGEYSETISMHSVVFDLQSNSWFFGADLRIPCACSGVSNFLNYAFLFGGLKDFKGNVQSFQDILQFDALSETWSEIGKLSVPRHSPVTAQIDSNIYIIGGFSTQEGNAVPTCEVLNTSERTVTHLAPLPHPISGMAGVIVPSTYS